MAGPTQRTKPRLYFAYGSNLSLAQMASRCPTSAYHSLGVLSGYRWIIGERGYANVVPAEDAVYGMLYSLEQQDEDALDRAEGVPHAYVKRELAVELLSAADGSVRGGGGGGGEVVEALVYVDEKRGGEGVCEEEYVARMNRGIKDAMGKGMQRSYVDRVLRPFVREERPGEGEGEVRDPFHPQT